MRKGLVQQAAAEYSKRSKTKRARAQKPPPLLATQHGGAFNRAQRVAHTRKKKRRRQKARPRPRIMRKARVCGTRTQIAHGTHRHMKRDAPKYAAEGRNFFPYFFPYAASPNLSAHTTRRRESPAKRHKNARLYTSENAPLQFKSGCHLQS